MNRFGLREFEQWLATPISIDEILKELVPGRHFAHARFATYRPDPRYPSQQEAVRITREFATKQSSWLEQLWSHPNGAGLYLDGGFGVGKTHLLASAYYAHRKGPKSYLTFEELMYLVGLAGLEATVRSFRRHTLLTIDEFELDDPANTRIATNLLGQFLDYGVQIITTSNTPPGALGEGKFSVDGFRRELGGLFEKFQIIRLEGEDYRKQPPSASTWLSPGSAVTLGGENVLTCEFDELLRALSNSHPMRVRFALSHCDTVHLATVHPIEDAYAALRFVYFIDKLYAQEIRFSATASHPITSLFAPSIMRGGDSKKYLRTLSRLEELTSGSMAHVSVDALNLAQQ